MNRRDEAIALGLASAFLGFMAVVAAKEATRLIGNVRRGKEFDRFLESGEHWQELPGGPQLVAIGKDGKPYIVEDAEFREIK